MSSVETHSTGSVNNDENKKRGNWSGKFDFILSAIGFAVGLGNVWRFPYLCQRNGGGSFLIPYVIMLAICGLPLFFFELAFGQFANLGPITIWNSVPLFRGVGVAMIIISALVCVYYNVVIAWAVYYMFASMSAKLPWTDCTNEWNDMTCITRFHNVSGQQNVPGNTRFNPRPTRCNSTLKTNCTVYQTPAEQYWQRVVLGLYDYNGTLRLMDNIGQPQWHLSLALLFSWVLVFLCMIKGIKSSGKVVYFTAVFPYVVLIILCIYGATLEGSIDGVLYYLTPDFNRLTTAATWSDAAVQIFYSLGVGFGGLMTMASYNKFNNNCYRDSLVVAVINCGTSVFAGFVVFSVLGYMAKKSGVPIADVVQSGPGLVFIVYPEGIASMPAPQLWSILFFAMLITLGLDSEFTMMETVMTGVFDQFPVISKTPKRKIMFQASICTLFFFLGLTEVCQGGYYYFELVNWYSASFSLFAVAFCELIAICYFYGVKKFCRDVEMMLGFRPNPYWIGCWVFVTPVAIAFIFIFSIVQYVPIYYGTYVYPDFGQALGWLIVLASAVFIPIGMIYELVIAGQGVVCKRTVRELDSWGPCIDKFWDESDRYVQKRQNLEESKKYQYSNDSPPTFNGDHGIQNSSFMVDDMQEKTNL